MQQNNKNWDGESEPPEDILKFICSYYCNKNIGSQHLTHLKTSIRYHTERNKAWALEK